MEQTPADLGPQQTSIEAILRVATHMSLPQVVKLATAVTHFGVRSAERKAAIAAAPLLAADVTEHLAKARDQAFPDLRSRFLDDDRRIERHISSPAYGAVFATSALSLISGALCALLALAGSVPWAVALAAGALGVLGLGGSIGSVVVRLQREDAYLETIGQLAWTAVCDASFAVAVADRCTATGPWDAPAYNALTGPWASAILPVPTPSG